MIIDATADPSSPVETIGETPAPALAPAAPPPLRLLLDLDAAAAGLLAKAETVAAHAAKRPIVRRLRQVFWDTPGLTIGRQGIGFAIETVGRRKHQLLRPIGAAPTGGRILLPIAVPLEGDRLGLGQAVRTLRVEVEQQAQRRWRRCGRRRGRRLGRRLDLGRCGGGGVGRHGWARWRNFMGPSCSSRDRAESRAGSTIYASSRCGRLHENDFTGKPPRTTAARRVPLTR